MVKSLRKKSGKKSRKSKLSKLRRSKSHHCKKHGYLKTPVRDAKTGRMRYCKKRRSRKYGGNKGDLRQSAKRDYKKSRKSSRKSSRKRKCKYGELKNPVRLPSGRMRYCKLKKKSAKKKSTKKKSKSKRKSSRKSSRKRKCKHGMLKTPVRLSSGRMRYCKLKKSARKLPKKQRGKVSKKKCEEIQSEEIQEEECEEVQSESEEESKAKKKSAKAKKKAAKDLGCEVNICTDQDPRISKSMRKKYCERKGPPFSAAACDENEVATGNDKKQYMVKVNSRGFKSWRKLGRKTVEQLNEMMQAQPDDSGLEQLFGGTDDESDSGSGSDSDSDSDADDGRTRDVLDADGNVVLARSSQGR